MAEQLDEETTEPVSCAGCKKVIGLTTSISPVPRIYCSEQCLLDFPVSAQESRDDLIFQMLHKDSMPKGEIGKAFGLSRQRIIQMAHARRDEGVLSE